MKSSARRLERRGFALVVTLSLMILLTVIAVGLLTLSAVSLRGGSQGLAEAEARANARLALMLAIGDLQKQLGPDQRISMTADQRSQGGDGGESSAAAGSHYWTGVYDSWPANQDARPTPSFRAWLVSGDFETLNQAGAADSGVGGSSAIELVGTGTLGTVGNGQVKVAPITLAKDDTPGSRLAWWVGDQGVKAAIATPPPSKDTSLATVRNNLQAAPRNGPGVATANSAQPFANVTADDERVMRVTSWQQAGLLASNPGEAKPLFHDLTAFSTGLLTNVRSGGFRKDLSMKLEQDFSSADLTKSANVLYSVSGEPGINFQELWADYHLHEQLQYSGGNTFTTGGQLAANTPFLQLAAGTAAAAADNWFYLKQPIVISYQLVLSFSMRPYTDPSTHVVQNRLQVDFDPVVTLWNPLDVPVVVPPCPAQDASKYTWYWAGFWQVPYDVNVTINGVTKNCSLMRSVSNNRNSDDNNWISLTVGVGEQLVFKPGEVIRISQTGNTTAANAVYSPLTGRKGFNYGGGVTFPLIDNTNNPIFLNPTDLITYSATANNLTSGKDSSGGNVIGSGNSRRWSLTHDYFMIGNPYGGPTIGIGQVSLDSCFGYKRPTYVAVSPGTPGSNITASNSTRLYANNFPKVFPAIQGQDTREIPAASIDCSSNPLSKAPFMVFAYDAKTEKDSKLGTRSFAQFNPRAFHVNFFSLSDQERDMLPYEVTVTPMTSWLKAPLDVTPNGNGFYGASQFAEWGSSFVTTHGVPREPLVSLAAFQHLSANGFNFIRPVLNSGASTGAYEREPLLPHVLHAIGNSLAPPMLASDQTQGSLPNYSPYHPLADHSYLANRALWDDYFLSGITPQQTPAFASARDQKSVAADFFAGKTPLPETRYLPALDGQDATKLLATFFNGVTPNDTAINQLADYLRVDGLFNVNSTSIEGWKTVLAALKDRPVVTRSETGAETTTPTSGKTPVATLAAPKNVITQDDSNPNGEQWVGLRALSDDDIDSLARAIVKEVRKRGPFISLADFVNRRVGTNKDLAKSGAIQSALDSADSSVNKNQNTQRAVSQATAKRFAFPEAEQGPIDYGNPDLVKQADILTPIAPALSVRSDTFLIRAHGEAVDHRGKLLARAWCEAVVERDRNFVDPEDDVATLPADLKKDVNKTFGRRFLITSFRWLSPREI